MMQSRWSFRARRSTSPGPTIAFSLPAEDTRWQIQMRITCVGSLPAFRNAAIAQGIRVFGSIPSLDHERHEAAPARLHATGDEAALITRATGQREADDHQERATQGARSSSSMKLRGGSHRKCDSPGKFCWKSTATDSLQMPTTWNHSASQLQCFRKATLRSRRRSTAPRRALDDFHAIAVLGANSAYLASITFSNGHAE